MKERADISKQLDTLKQANIQCYQQLQDKFIAYVVSRMHGLTQYKLAYMSGLSHSAVSRILSRSKTAELKDIIALSAALGQTLKITLTDPDGTITEMITDKEDRE